jgi:branched-chain amino acid transport system permease protein
MSATTEFHAEAATVADGQVTTLPWRTLGSRRLITRSGAALLLAAFVLAGPHLFTWAGPAGAMNFGLTVAMLVLAVSVLGWIGEISLAPVAQMGFGVVAVNVCQVHDIPFGFTLPIVALASLPISLLLAAFTLRLKGVSFAIATLAFAYMAQKTFFQEYLGVQGGFGGTDSKSISRPAGFSGSEKFYYLVMGSLLLMALACTLVNRSWIGTSLTALRHSEAAFSVLGHSPGAYKLFTICLSGAIATVGGAYFGMLQGLVPSNYFQPGLAILYFGFAVAGGLGSVAGAVVAGTAFGAIPKYFDSLSEGKLVGYDLFFIGIVSLGLVLWAPGGLADIGRRLWRRLAGDAPVARAVTGFEEIDLSDSATVTADEGLTPVDVA